MVIIALWGDLDGHFTPDFFERRLQLSSKTHELKGEKNMTDRF